MKSEYVIVRHCPTRKAYWKVYKNHGAEFVCTYDRLKDARAYIEKQGKD